MKPQRNTSPEHPTLEQACAVMRRAYKLGWISTRDGNISVAMTDGRGFLTAGAAAGPGTPVRPDGCIAS